MGSRASARPALTLALSLAMVAGCAKAPANELPASESPQAKAEPPPLAIGPMPLASAQPIVVNPDAGPPPVPMRGDVPLPVDSVGKEIVEYTLQAAVRVIDPPAAFKGPEVSAAAIEAARRKTEPRVAIDLSPGHARVVLSSHGFVLPEDTELRARVDRYGFIVVLPGESSYRIAAPGSLRALLGERRIDVAPLSPADVIARGEGPRRLGYRTRKVDVVNRAASATFEIVRVPDVGEGGALACRLLLDLMSAPPSTPVCGVDEVPLHVEVRWTTRGGLIFDAFGLARRLETSPQLLAAPPANLAFTLPSIPGIGAELLITPAELAAFRTGPSDVAPAPGAAHKNDPQNGLVIANATDQLRMLWIDGTPVAWIAPGAREALPTLLRGRYGVQWRTFWGDAIEPAQTITVPGTTEVGPLDAGASK
jgi:hypothetical protein